MFEDSPCDDPSSVSYDDSWSPAVEEPPTAGERLVAALAAGPGGAAGVLLAGVDPAALRADEKVRLVQAWEAQAAHAQAGQARALAALDLRHPDDGTEVVLDPAYTDVEVRTALRLAPGVATARLDLARALDRRLRPTRKALAEGQISWAHAQVISDGLSGLDEPARVADVQEQVLRLAAGRTPAATRHALARLVLSVDPDAAQRRHAEARAERHVRVWPLPDGMSALHVEGPAEQVAHAYQTLTDAALGGGADATGVDASRADLALAWLTGGAAARPAPGSRRPRVLVTVAMSTLLGCDDLPAHLAGYGWITGQAARRIAADGTWQRLLLDPASGRVLDYGRATYRPPRDLAEHVELRDATCRAPHCARPAWQCDLDHVVPYGAGGTTSAGNLHAACRHDHGAKTHGGWTVQTRPCGTTTWTSARGIPHDVPPPDPPPAARPLDPPSAVDARPRRASAPSDPDPPG